MPAASFLISAALGNAAPLSEAEANFYRRAEALAADEACEFLSAPEREILEAGLSQARRDLLALGVGPGRIDTALARIRTDRRLAACETGPVIELAGYARDAARQVMRQPVEVFDGARRSWQVDRTGYEFVRWPVLQQMDGARFGRAVLEGDPDRRDGVDARKRGTALVIEGDRGAVSAVLVLRDTTRAASRYDRTLGGLLALPDGEPAARYSAPPHAERRIVASATLSRDRALRLLTDTPRPEGEASGFVFPDSALERLAELEPGEAAAIELYDGRGRRIERLWIEIGHLRAALTFAALPYAPSAAIR